MSKSTIVVERVNGYLQDEHGKDHPVSFDLEVLYTSVDHPSEVIKKPNGGIRDWVGAALPEGDYLAKTFYLGRSYKWPKRMVGRVLRQPGRVK
jgi:hypothetical protein